MPDDKRFKEKLLKVSEKCYVSVTNRRTNTYVQRASHQHPSISTPNNRHILKQILCKFRRINRQHGRDEDAALEREK